MVAFFEWPFIRFKLTDWKKFSQLIRKTKRPAIMIDKRRRDTTLNHLSQNIILITSSKEMGQPIHKLKIFQTKQKNQLNEKNKTKSCKK